MGYDERKTEKRGFRRGTMNEKREKEAFVGVRRVKIGENRLSPVRENQKTIKIAFPSRGKTRNHRKSLFPTLGRLKNSEKQLSQTWEEQKCRWLRFPILGKTKSPRKLGEITFGGRFILLRSLFL